MRFLTLLIVLFSCTSAFAAEPVKTITAYPVSFSVSCPLRELFATNEEANERIDSDHEMEDRSRRRTPVFRYSANDGSAYGDAQRVRQTSIPVNRISNLLNSWAGQVGTANPPDPTGAAGINHYVQIVNATRMKIFDKSGNAIGTVIDVARIWNPQITNGGDPIVLYDKYADRWVISQLSATIDSLFYIAVSTSGDPAGTYYCYTFSSTYFPDYPKYSIWADGYYMTCNYLGPDNSDKLFCFERDQMILGNPAARYVTTFYDPGVTSGFYLAMPGDADGQLPPFGSPLPIVSFYDNGWDGGADSIKIWNVSVDWSGATPTASVTATPSLLPAEFDASYDPDWNDIPQPGTASMLDGMGGIVQYRAQWRMWTGYNTMLLCIPVRLSLSPPVRAIRWMELRQDQSSGLWSIYQESTFAPDDYCRWMGSMAMDDEGNIALCYAKSGPTSLVPNVYPSLGYTGRLATDPLNTMTFGENMVVNGTSIINLTRFGDYAQTSLDPDGLTFWHTGEYVSLGKRTQIYSFRLSSIPAGISDKPITGKFNVFFSSNAIHVQAAELKEDGQYQIDLFTVKGQKVKTVFVNSIGGKLEDNIETSGFVSGTYLLRLGRKNSFFQKVSKVEILK